MKTLAQHDQRRPKRSGVYLTAAVIVASPLMAIMVGTARAQLSATTGSLAVTIRDAADASIPGVDVTVTHVSGNRTVGGRTDISGRALFSTPQPEEFEVVVAHEEFTSQKAKAKSSSGTRDVQGYRQAHPGLENLTSNAPFRERWMRRRDDS